MGLEKELLPDDPPKPGIIALLVERKLLGQLKLFKELLPMFLGALLGGYGLLVGLLEYEKLTLVLEGFCCGNELLPFLLLLLLLLFYP
jgi:hypothetical protein